MGEWRSYSLEDFLLFQPRVPECRLLDWNRFDEMVAAGYSQARQMLAGLTDGQREMFR